MREDLPVFMVVCTYPLDGRDVEEMDLKLYVMAGDRKSDGSGAGTTSMTGRLGIRDHYWYVRTIKEARNLVNKLNKVEGAKATLREK